MTTIELYTSNGAKCKVSELEYADNSKVFLPSSDSIISESLIGSKERFNKWQSEFLKKWGDPLLQKGKYHISVVKGSDVECDKEREKESAKVSEFYANSSNYTGD